MSTLNNSVQYVSVIHPGEKVAKLVKRMHYVSFVGMFRSDLFEGLCVGHAPKKCKICGKWFLTTNARHTKYCGGYAPGDKLHRTCRQIGNLKGREQRELADDHPCLLYTSLGFYSHVFNFYFTLLIAFISRLTLMDGFFE